MKDIKKPAKEVWKNFHDEPSTSSINTNTKINSNSNRSSTNSKTATSQFSTTFATKLASNSPYNLFFTVIPDSPQTKNQDTSIQFTGILLIIY